MLFKRAVPVSAYQKIRFSHFQRYRLRVRRRVTFHTVTNFWMYGPVPLASAMLQSPIAKVGGPFGLTLLAVPVPRSHMAVKSASRRSGALVGLRATRTEVTAGPGTDSWYQQPSVHLFRPAPA